MTRANGAIGIRQLSRFLVLPLVVAMILTLLVPYNAQAVHDTGAFELDGNAVSDTSGPPDDWDRVCNQVTAGAQCTSAGPTQAFGGATAVGWTAEPDPSASIFTGGGSKDPIDINQWAWKDAGGLPDKDNLLHGFSARYSLAPSATCPSTGSTCEVLYFGSDRFDNSGDAQQGFWFLQNAIGLAGAKSGGGTGFSCQGSCATSFHQTGDVLVISDFSNGGTVATMTIYKWDPGTCPTGREAGCGDMNLFKLASSDQALCGNPANPSPDRACGIVNTATGLTTAPWSYTDKSGNNAYLQGEFFEGGINLSSFNLGNECFSSVVAETRSSTSTTAVLKDFIVTPFAVCGASLKTQASSPSIPIGSSLTDDATVTVSGGANPPAPTGTVSFFVCGPTASSCATTGTAFDTKLLSGAVKSGNDYTVTSASFTPNAAGTWCFAASWPGDTNYTAGPYRDNGANECFTVTPGQPTIVTSQTAGPLPLGSTIKDTATLANTAPKPNGDPAGGTIVFNVYGPRADPAVADCSAGKLVFTSPIPFNVTGNGTYGPESFTPTLAGTYDWVATYSGDTPNTLGVSSTCGDEASVVISLQPTMTTAQRFRPNDSATVTVTSGGGDLAGNLKFQLFVNNTTCSGSPDYDSGTIDITTGTGSGLSRTVSSNNTNAYATTGAAFSWLVTYTSTNGGHNNVTATCNAENSSITIANDGPFITP